MIEAETRARSESGEPADEDVRPLAAYRPDAPGAEPAGPERDRTLNHPERPPRERERAASYLDLWERHVSGTAIQGRGIAAPWFSR